MQIYTYKNIEPTLTKLFLDFVLRQTRRLLEKVWLLFWRNKIIAVLFDIELGIGK
jgi:hypothetical protein